MCIEVNSYALRQHEERTEQNSKDFEKMIFELKQNVLDNSEESESAFNLIVNDYGFEYDFSTFVKDELC